MQPEAGTALVQLTGGKQLYPHSNCTFQNLQAGCDGVGTGLIEGDVHYRIYIYTKIWYQMNTKTTTHIHSPMQDE